MAKFKFRLQSLLSYKEKMEQALQAELAVLQEECRREHQRLEALLEEERIRLEDLQGQLSEKLDLQTIVYAVGYLDGLAAQIERHRAQLAAIAEKVEQKRAELLVATQERRTLEELLQRQLLAHRQEETRAEGKLLDEVAVGQFRRRAASAP